MKVVILAGGFGTRISEESHLIPKPMIEIGGKPILWHIMKGFSSYGFNDFIICSGYKQHIVKEYFANYYLHSCDITFDFTDSNNMVVHSNVSDPWKVTVVDTGLNTMTGGRLKRVEKFIDNEVFMMTYGDGVSNVKLDELLKYHQFHKKTVTMTAVDLAQKFGVIDVADNGEILSFREKSDSDHNIINGGFMVLNSDIFKYIEGDDTVFEKETLPKVAAKNELMAYRHKGFWKCMDTQRDKQQLETLWASGSAPWKIW
jgi:glucose-1-phosphate cytidylyltransferase